MFRSKKGGEKLLKDDRRPHKKDLMRPSFSREPGCWIIDHVFNLARQGDIWFFAVNMNTRFLFAKRVRNKSARQTIEALNSLSGLLGGLPKSAGITCIVGDGDKGFNAQEQQQMMTFLNYRFYFNSSAYTYHNKILDRCVRTIRDAIAYHRHPDVNHIVSEYNSSYHKAIDCTPLQMTEDTDLEWQYIRYCNERLNEVLRLQQEHLDHYEPGNVIAVHLEMQRTPEKFQKQRRYWNRIGVFRRYVHGNVEVQLYNMQTPVVVPIYFTKLIAINEKSVPQNVIDTYESLLGNLSKFK
jgi:hypothetical protein